VIFEENFKTDEAHGPDVNQATIALHLTLWREVMDGTAIPGCHRYLFSSAELEGPSIV